MEPAPLTQKEKKELRGIAQRLKPHLSVGRNGLTDTVLKEVDLALTKNGLIKIRFEVEKELIKAHCCEIPEKTGSTLIGQVGKTASFFREMPATEVID